MSEGKVEDIFRLLEHLLARSRVRLDRRARAIDFEVEGARFRFDPRAKDELFKRDGGGDVALRLKIDRALLLRLVTAEDFELDDREDVEFDGDIEALLPLAQALEAGASSLNVRNGPTR